MSRKNKGAFTQRSYTEKEAANLKADSIKLNLLELLKQESP